MKVICVRLLKRSSSSGCAWRAEEVAGEGYYQGDRIKGTVWKVRQKSEPVDLLSAAMHLQFTKIQ